MKLRSILWSAAAMIAIAGPAYSAETQGAANVQVVKSFLKDIREAMASRDPAKVRAVAEHYMDKDYIQHSSGYAPGREGFIKGMSSVVTGGGGPPPGAPPAGGASSGPPPTPKDLYFLGDGEIVVWVSEGMEPGKLMFNMVRVVDGKMKEHWDGR